MADITIDGISFNIDYFGNYTEEQFIERGMRSGKDGWYRQFDDDKRLALIRNAFNIIKGGFYSNKGNERSGSPAAPILKSKTDGQPGITRKYKKHKSK